jgi:hypothetical protein
LGVKAFGAEEDKDDEEEEEEEEEADEDEEEAHPTSKPESNEPSTSVGLEPFCFRLFLNESD